MCNGAEYKYQNMEAMKMGVYVKELPVKPKRIGGPFMTIVEHYFRLISRFPVEDIRGDVSREWYTKTEQWLLDNCSPEEQTAVVDYYVCNRSARSCQARDLREMLHDIGERYACDVGLWERKNRKDDENNGTDDI